ncbi:MAG: PhoH family protein [Treponema sp.]|jgi:phosphate starvation-inducible PhoH-like protein|nr:PhoH family protein [Treponema sp.]
MEEGITIAFDNRELLSGICGANDVNLRIIESSLGGFITARGNEIHFESRDEAGGKRFRTMMDNLIAVVKEGEEPSAEYIRALADEFIPGEASERPQESGQDSVIQIPHGFRRVYPRSKNQSYYIRQMRENEICFCIGPAGTGKTYLAIAHSLQMVLSKRLRKLVLTRPVVEAGENLGFLPGDLSQKIDPYLRPLHDAMESLIPYEVIHRMEETMSIEIAPLAYMRGRSLNDCMVILDEAQNTTREQMKMFLTRIGCGARAVITGDVTQIDLPRKTDSGLLHAMEILRGIDGLSFSFLHTSDVARNLLIKKIIQAYNESET